MRGPGPHLGRVLTEGRFSGYQIEGRAWLHGSSNQRGAMLFTMPGFTLAPGGAHELAWRLFWHQGWADFEARLSREPAHLAMRAERYTLIQGRTLRVRLARRPKTLTLDGRALRPAASVASVPRTLEAKAGPATATLKAFVIPPVTALLRARAGFIVERQQVTDRHDPLHGALLCYDNLAEARVCDPNWGDQNEARERLGMGVFLAQMLARRRDARTVAALRRYHAFVRHKLQRRDGRVLNGVGDPRERLYNYMSLLQPPPQRCA